MAFLAKKVPKIFPSKTKKVHDDLCPSRHSSVKSSSKPKKASLFHKLHRETETEPLAQKTPDTKKKHTTMRLATGETLDCRCGDSNNDGSSDGNNSSASTLESSPTPIPRETKEPNTLVLPDLPNLKFPCSTKSSSNYDSSTPLPSSLRLAPRTISNEESSDASFKPPLEVVSVPMGLPLAPPPPSSSCSSLPRSVVASCLTRPPPRADKWQGWDDATISSEEVDDETDQDSSASFSLSQKQQRETAAAEASAIMKPWIDRAARLALLQNRACGNYREHQQQRQESFTPSLRQRRREAALSSLRPGSNPRALLASLEKGQDASTTKATDPSCNDRHREQYGQPRIVKWHVVRQPR